MRKFALLILVLALVPGILYPAGVVQADSGVQPGVVTTSQNMLEGNSPAQIDAASWYSGQIVYSTITNCVSIIQGFPYTEYGMGTYVSFAADPEAAQPGPGQVYYISIVIAGLGNACSGQRAYLDVQLPANTSLAISASNPVRCYAGGVPLNPPADCPQTLPASPYHSGAYAIFSTDAAHNYTWPVPQGGMWEFQVPVVSSTTLTNSTLQANVLAMDGNDNPWLRPTVGLYVFSSTPTIIYPSPSTEITESPTPTYKSQAYLYSFGLGGTAYFELGTTTGYGLVTDSIVVPAGESAWYLWDDWQPFPLQPNTTYHWRLRFSASNGQNYFGVDQVFTTLPTGQVTVGNGAASSCTAGALASALASPGVQTILFDCGAAPVSISLSASASITANVTIDGNNRVTLDSNNAFRHFSVNNGSKLTLKKLVLTGGNVTGCGGAVRVVSGMLETNNVSMVNNHANGNGGAVCVEAGATALLYQSLLRDNSASGNGGAIYNLGNTETRWSDITNNSAQVNGGGIWNGNYTEVYGSVIAENSVPWGGTVRGSREGGGIYNIATVSVSTSTIANNTASFAGGIYNKNADLYLTGITLAGNRASAQIGGLESSGSGSSNIRNSIIASNSPDNCGSDPAKTIVSQGNNLDSGNQCKFLQASDLLNTNPLLRPLAFNGGFNRTMALMPASPAIDHADNTYCGMFDQRGFVGSYDDIALRQMDGDGNGSIICDMGAFEYTPGTDASSFIFLPTLLR